MLHHIPVLLPCSGYPPSVRYAPQVAPWEVRSSNAQEWDRFSGRLLADDVGAQSAR